VLRARILSEQLWQVRPHDPRRPAGDRSGEGGASCAKVVHLEAGRSAARVAGSAPRSLSMIGCAR
jgi:hypothetical protein